MLCRRETMQKQKTIYTEGKQEFKLPSPKSSPDNSGQASM